MFVTFEIFNTSADLLGIAALLTSILGCVTTVITIKRTRREERAKNEEGCVERLRATRKEAEELAQELHALKMSRIPHTNAESLKYEEDKHHKLQDDLADWGGGS